MTNKAHNTPLINHILLILMGAMLLFLMVGFARQVGASHQRHQELAQIEQQISLAAEEQVELQKQLDFATSPEALELYARQLGQTRSNEVLVVPFGTGSESSTARDEALDKSDSPDSSRDAWWELFFGTD
jgi:cell division protein FtsL